MTDNKNQLKVISIGDIVADLIVAIPHLPVEPDKHQLVHEFRLEPGGAGNFLIAGSRLGMRMFALGAIGSDPFGGVIIDVLEDESVDTTGVIRQDDTSSTTVVVLVDDNGQHVFLGGYGVGPSIPFPESWAASIPESDAVFASGYTFQEKRLAESAVDALELASRKNIPVFFDPGPEMVHTNREQIAAVLAYSDILLMTEDEIPLLTDGREGLEAANKLLVHNPHTVCVKRGPNGCVILREGNTIQHPGFDVPVKDTTAAGDSFAAAFIYAYLNGFSLNDTAAFANAMGAAKVCKVGSGRQVPTAGEVRDVLDNYHVDIEF